MIDSAPQLIGEPTSCGACADVMDVLPRMHEGPVPQRDVRVFGSASIRDLRRPAPSFDRLERAPERRSRPERGVRLNCCLIVRHTERGGAAPSTPTTISHLPTPLRSPRTATPSLLIAHTTHSSSGVALYRSRSDSCDPTSDSREILWPSRMNDSLPDLASLGTVRARCSNTEGLARALLGSGAATVGRSGPLRRGQASSHSPGAVYW